jgi:hypothetical protein
MYGFGKIVFNSGRIEVMPKLREVISRKSYKAFIFMWRCRTYSGPARINPSVLRVLEWVIRGRSESIP